MENVWIVTWNRTRTETTSFENRNPESELELRTVKLFLNTRSSFSQILQAESNFPDEGGAGVAVNYSFCPSFFLLTL